MYKVVVALACCLAFSGAALAQEKELDFKMTNTEINLVGKALGKMPFDEVAPLVNKLRTQYMSAANPPKPEEKKQEEPKKAE